MTPSLVFLGERLYANGLDPNALPKNSPPLSAYQAKQKVIAINLGLDIVN